MTTAVLYARVSSQRQADEGYSIDAQLHLLRNFAARHAMEVVQEFIESGSASTRAQRERPIFRAMMDFLRSGGAEVVVIHKPDRATRNPRDQEELLELAESGISIRFAGGAPTIEQGLNAGARLQMRIQTAIDTHYSEALGESVRTGMTQKAREGIYPGKPPLGYRTVQGKGRATLEPHPTEAHLIREMFGLYATGEWSDSDLAGWAWSRGLTARGGSRLSRSVIERMLRRPLYHGEFEWGGEVYDSKFPSVIPAKLWQQVQEMRERKNRWRSAPSPMPYARLIRCGRCGGNLVGQSKTNRHGSTYDYYACTHRAAECQGHQYPPGETRHVRQEVIEAAIQERLAELRIPDSLVAALRSLARDKLGILADGEARERDRLQRLDASLTTKIRRAGSSRISGDQEMDPEDYRAVVEEWREERRLVRSQLEDLSGDVDDLEEAACEAVELAAGAAKVWGKLRPEVRRHLANHFFENLVWEDGRLSVTWRPVWGILRARTLGAAALEAAGADLLTRAGVWLAEDVRTPSGSAPRQEESASLAPEMGMADREGHRRNLPISLVERLASARPASPQLLEALEVVRLAA